MGLSTEMRVGAVFFVGVCLLVLFTLVLTDIRLFKKYYTVDVFFNAVGGLEKGNKVAIGGMEVGDVKDLILEAKQVRVRLAIRNTYQVPLTASFRVIDVGLLGGKRVDITWGEETDAYLRPGGEIQGISTPGLSEAIASLGDSGQKVEDILSSVREVADRIARGEGTVGKLIQEEEIYNEAKQLISDLQEAVAENRENVKAVIGEMKESAPRLKATIGNLEEITDKINRGEGTLGKLINDEDFYDSAQESLASVKTASQKLTDLASRAERVQLFIGAETAYNIDTRRYLSKAFLEIEPTPSKLYRLGFSLLSGPGTEAEQKDKPETELDAQIGLRFFSDRLTIRAGVLEGRVGGGLDFRIWERKIIASVEARDVWSKDKDEGIEPFLLRARLDVDLIWGFYAIVGGDNLADHPGFDCGVGFRLRDDDIKALFGVTSIGQ